MIELKIHVGESGSFDAMCQRAISAWKRAEAGEDVNERHLSFSTLQQAAAVLTPQRLALLREIHRNPPTGIRALAARVGRDFADVQADVQALLEHDLLDQDDAGGLRTDYDGIAVEMSLAL